MKSSRTNLNPVQPASQLIEANALVLEQLRESVNAIESLASSLTAAYPVPSGADDCQDSGILPRVYWMLSEQRNLIDRINTAVSTIRTSI